MSAWQGLENEAANQQLQQGSLGTQPYSGLQQRPYYQDGAQRKAQPTQQQAPLQQIPFLPQQLAPKHPAANQAQGNAAAQQQPAVSSRLSALKARLDSEKVKGADGKGTAPRSVLSPWCCYLVL